MKISSKIKLNPKIFMLKGRFAFKRAKYVSVLPQLHGAQMWSYGQIICVCFCLCIYGVALHDQK